VNPLVALKVCLGAEVLEALVAVEFGIVVHSACVVRQSALIDEGLFAERTLEVAAPGMNFQVLLQGLCAS
jgi:hypothetical protein